MGYMRIPTHSGHPFRSIPATYSGAFRPPPSGSSGGRHLGDVVDFYHFSFSAHGLLFSGQIELEGT